MIRSRFVFACALLCALSGCKSLLKKREAVTTEASAAAASAPAPVVAASAPAPAVSAAPVADADEAIPTSQDFEDEALEKVTAANFKTELVRLKKEIEKK